MVDRKFFKFDDGSAFYFAVARDADHAKNMLMDAGLEWGDPSTRVPPDPIELTADSASRIRCDVSDATGEEPDTLADCNLDDWFSAEYWYVSSVGDAERAVRFMKARGITSWVEDDAGNFVPVDA